MKKSLIFFDIDGTMCPYAGEPSPETYEAFRLLHERGHVMFLCTGRGRIDIPDSIMSIGFEGVISSMGADIEIGNKHIQHRYIPDDMLRETVSSLIENTIAAQFVGYRDMLRTENMTSVPEDILVLRSAADLDRLPRFPHISSIDVEYRDAGELDRCMPALKKHSVVVEYTPNSGQTELLDVNKAVAVRRILDMPEYQGFATYAVGDGQNDIGMLKAVDVGIAMGGSPPEVRNASDYVTGTMEDGGLHNALLHFQLI